MTTNENKELVIKAYTALGTGDKRTYFDCLADDVQITLYGTHCMARTFSGKKDFLENLVPVFRDTIDGFVKLHIKNVIAEGENVVVEMDGEGKTKDNRIYNNHYCFCVKVRDGKIAESREYMDTELVKSIFG
jgi:uncharacterized protein